MQLSGECVLWNIFLQLAFGMTCVGLQEKMEAAAVVESEGMVIEVYRESEEEEGEDEEEGKEEGEGEEDGEEEEEGEEEGEGESEVEEEMVSDVFV